MLLSIIPNFNLKSKLPSLSSLGKNIESIFSNPLSIFAIIGLLVLLIFFIRMKKIKFTASMMTQVAMAVALTALLNAMQIAKMPQGGSVTPGSMIPLIFIALIYGTEVGVLAGFLFGIVNFIMGPFILNPVQVLFDYPLAFMLVGLAGLFKDRNKQLAVVVGMGARWLCHVISGVVFFSSYAGDQNPIIYSMVYNASYLIPETIIALVVISALPILRIKKAISYNR